MKIKMFDQHDRAFYDLYIKSEILCTQYSKNCFITSQGILSGLIVRIFTARLRGLGQGNIFGSVCQSFCRWGGVVCAWSLVHSGGLCPGRSLSAGLHPRDLCLGGALTWGSLSRGGQCPGWLMSRIVSVQGDVFPGGLCQGDHGDPPAQRPPTIKSRRYAYYWNAFFFKIDFDIISSIHISTKNSYGFVKL